MSGEDELNGLGIIAAIVILCVGGCMLHASDIMGVEQLKTNEHLSTVTTVAIFANGEVATITGFNSVQQHDPMGWYYIDFDDKIIFIRGAMLIENDTLKVIDLYAYDVDWK